MLAFYHYEWDSRERVSIFPYSYTPQKARGLQLVYAPPQLYLMGESEV
jgi:hypothetical protein